MAMERKSLEKQTNGVRNGEQGSHAFQTFAYRMLATSLLFLAEETIIPSNDIPNNVFRFVATMVAVFGLDRIREDRAKRNRR